MIPFSPPRIDDKIIEEVVDALQSGWITTGPKTKRFEKELTEYVGCRKTVCLNSGTAGMELMLSWFGVGPGDEVIVPSYTYCATANVVVHTGATPIMCDVKEDFNIDVSKLEGLITEKTKVIIPVDIAGLPVDYDELNELVRKKSIRSKFTPSTEVQELLGRIMILADGAHSIGAKYKGKMSGTLADATAFSFHAVKNLTTAEGGAIALNLPYRFDPERMYADLCTKALHGQTKDAFAKVQKGGWRYDVVEAGYKYNMTDILASIGLVELERYESDTLKKRQHIYDRYNQLLAQYDWAWTPEFDDETKQSNHHLYLLRIKDVTEHQRNLIIYEIYEQDVSVNVHYQPLPMLSFYKHRGYNIDDYPQAFKNYTQEISLPIYYDLSDEDIETVVKAVVVAVEKVLSKQEA
ncbi:MAG: capsular biosynthesis protein [Crocinitomicaceae bacterium]|nr:capsular biosynthesis protein [Crocinitomicaceae bacterium]|tara:strand:- start:5790 stop:7013 length:1224 start_codon:yes stop_codon:yes gene_type:complete